MVKGLLLLREYYKNEYKKALQDKIEKQKKTFQQRQAYLEEEAKLSQELEVIKCNVQVISKRLPPVLCIFPLEINIKQKTSDEGKIIALQQEVRHKVSHKLPRSFVLNDSQFKSGIQTDLNKVSIKIGYGDCYKMKNE